MSIKPSLSDEERNQILVEWNDTHSDYPQDKCIHTAFEDQVKITPKNIALVFQDHQLTYQALNSYANRLSYYLREQGVGPEDLVGICVERSLEMVVGMLAVLKAGGAYVPIDPEYPPERVNFILTDSDAQILLTQGSLFHDFPDYDGKTFFLETDWEFVTHFSDENPAVDVSSNNLAYVIYTSGSTGIPKGVKIEHAGVLNLVFWHQSYFKILEKDKAAQISGLSFTATVWELWPYLLAGASVHLVPDEETRFSIFKLRDWLVSEAITICYIPTPIAEMIMLEQWPPETKLRTMLTGGDKLNQYPSQLLPFEFVNNYGMTENTVIATAIRLQPLDESPKTPPIGRPIANKQIYLLDSTLEPIPIGMEGMLFIGGVGLARNYHNRPALTAESFIPNPFSHNPGSRLYNTGDLARYLPDGNIEFQGRQDHQIKISGFRIEPGEVETVLSEHPAIQAAVVLVQGNTARTKCLTAYMIQKNGVTVNLDEIKFFLHQRLPDYMVPALYLFLETLPLTHNGKIDRTKLPDPNLIDLRSNIEYQAPRTPIESMVATLWEEVFGIDRVGIAENFFDLGGNSLIASQVIIQLNSKLKIDLPLQTIIDTDTLEDFSNTVLAKFLLGQNNHQDFITQAGIDWVDQGQKA